jgi:hypothetical protein
VLWIVAVYDGAGSCWVGLYVCWATHSAAAQDQKGVQRDVLDSDSFVSLSMNLSVAII